MYIFGAIINLRREKKKPETSLLFNSMNQIKWIQTTAVNTKHTDLMSMNKEIYVATFILKLVIDAIMLVSSEFKEIVIV